MFKWNTDGIRGGRSIGIESGTAGAPAFWCYHLTYYVGRKFKISRSGSARKNQSSFRLRQEKIEDDPAPGENLPPRPRPIYNKVSAVGSRQSEVVRRCTKLSKKPTENTTYPKPFCQPLFVASSLLIAACILLIMKPKNTLYRKATSQQGNMLISTGCHITRSGNGYITANFLI